MKYLYIFLFTLVLFVCSCSKNNSSQNETPQAQTSKITDHSNNTRQQDSQRRKQPKRKEPLDSLSAIKGVNPDDNIIIAVSAFWKKQKYNETEGCYLYYQTTDSLFTVDSYSFPTYNSFNYLMEKKNCLNIYLGGKRTGFLQFKTFQHFVDAIIFKKIEVFDTTNYSYYDSTMVPEHLIYIGSTKSSIPELEYYYSYPKEEHFSIAAAEALKLLQNETSDRPFKKEAVTIKKLDVINSPDTNRILLTGSCTYEFETTGENTLDLYTIFFILALDNDKADVEYSQVYHGTRYYEGSPPSIYFIDFFDIDEDGSSEIFTLELGYESEEIIVLKKKDNHWVIRNRLNGFFAG